MAQTASSKVSVASDDDSTIKVAPKRDKIDKFLASIKLKKPVPKHSKPGNWRDGGIIDVEDKKKAAETASANAPSPGPVVNQLDDSARETFATGRPLEDSPDLQVCKHCKKSVLKTAATSHVKACLKLKREKLQKKKEAKEARDREKRGLTNNVDGDGDTKMDDDDDDDDDAPKGPGGIKSAKKSAGKNNGDDKKGKKRKADGDAEKGPKQKKKKEEPKPKAPKPKDKPYYAAMSNNSPTKSPDKMKSANKSSKMEGPVDVERQCGVLKDGVPCARSLTCKSHSMGAKRAVPGRTLPYDMLLSQYQKKNQAKQQKAAIDANAPLEDEELANGPIDSDEELSAVQHGLSKWNPQPVVPPLVQYPIQYQYRDQRLWEQLHNATNGFTVNICKVKGFGAQKLPPGHAGLVAEVDADGDVGMGEAGEVGLGIAGVRRGSGFVLQGAPAVQRRQSAVSVTGR
ncbi:SAGA-associated factor 73 protein [Rutstroemia sp. NJR-2017a WRK4]|nr:SAGA-associated factor 73 protein [Rutstroemia sp. NJR-2017a WRK4]